MSLGEEPLAGCRIVITRATHQAEALITTFRAAGARVELLPLLEVRPASREALNAAVEAARASDWVVYTSTNAVRSLEPAGELASPVAEGLRHAVVGEATAAALRERGVEPDLVSSRPRASGLLRELLPLLRPGERVVLPQADDARSELAQGLRGAGFDVDCFVTYTKSLPENAFSRARNLFSETPLGWVSFTSPRIVRHFVEVLGEEWPRRRPELRALSIGPVTSAELRRFEIDPAAEAARPSSQAMVEAVVLALREEEEDRNG